MPMLPVPFWGARPWQNKFGTFATRFLNVKHTWNHLRNHSKCQSHMWQHCHSLIIHQHVMFKACIHSPCHANLCWNYCSIVFLSVLSHLLLKVSGQRKPEGNRNKQPNLSTAKGLQTKLAIPHFYISYTSPTGYYVSLFSILQCCNVQKCLSLSFQ